MIDPLGLKKTALRFKMRKRCRQACSERPDAGFALCSLFLARINLPPAAVVSFYHRWGYEIDPEPLGKALADRGHALALPCGTEKNKALAFRSFSFGDPLAPGIFGIPEPLEQANVIEPEILLVPLVGFDRKGHRLGQGGGYYDRSLYALRGRKKVTAIGLGFSDQELSVIPPARHDQVLDLIVTEKEIIDPAVSGDL